MSNFQEKIVEHLSFIYGEEDAHALTEELIKKLNEFKRKYPQAAHSSGNRRVSEKDVIIITYGDMVQKSGEAPLQTLAGFLKQYFGGVINAIHILPFYPYSSDDGFSVIDYRKVNPNLGTWEDIAALGKDFRLMFDAVVNHISASSAEFQGFLKGDKSYENFFTTADPDADISKVFRPRSSPLLTPVETSEGLKYVWTTFSADQIDLNYANPIVLFEVIDILLFYVLHGAEFIRLDAVTYLWKNIKTTSANLPETHRIIQLIRTVLDHVAPHIALVTETNVPHKDNIAYFGDGFNEAQMVYNFALPTLVLHTFHSGNARKLRDWAETLELPSEQATFFNFLASHDGIGVTPVRDILTSEEISAAVERTHKLGGNVAYKDNGDGTKSPYELNINYFDALSDPENPDESPDLQAKRFLAAQAIMLSLRGVPGIYFHSLVGSQNWYEGVAKSGRYRAINRQKLNLKSLEAKLSEANATHQYIYQGYRQLLNIRQSQPAFHPVGDQQILDLNSAVFGLTRTSLDGAEHLLCLHNTTDKEQSVTLDLDLLPFSNPNALINLVTDNRMPFDGTALVLKLAPYDVLWLTVAF